MLAAYNLTESAFASYTLTVTDEAGAQRRAPESARGERALQRTKPLLNPIPVTLPLGFLVISRLLLDLLEPWNTERGSTD